MNQEQLNYQVDENTNSSKNLISIREYIEQQESRVEKILKSSSGNIKASDLITKFLFSLSQEDKLMKCERSSILDALFFCAAKGILPDNKRVHLSTKDSGKILTATIGVQGLRELIRRNKTVNRVGTDVVRKKDKFKIISGLQPSIEHIINHLENSEMVGSYAFAELNTGGYLIRYCNLDEINDARKLNNSNQGPLSPWMRFPGEMYRLVALRKIAKELITDEINLTFDTEYEQNINRSFNGPNFSKRPDYNNKFTSKSSLVSSLIDVDQNKEEEAA